MRSLGVVRRQRSARLPALPRRTRSNDHGGAVIHIYEHNRHGVVDHDHVTYVNLPAGVHIHLDHGAVHIDNPDNITIDYHNNDAIDAYYDNYAGHNPTTDVGRPVD